LILSQDFTSSTSFSGVHYAMTAIPGTKAVLGHDAAIGYTIFNFAFGNKATDAVFPIKGQGAVCWVAHSKNTGSFYLSDLDKSIVIEVDVTTNLNLTIVTVSFIHQKLKRYLTSSLQQYLQGSRNWFYQ
jgi:hypothetical protein